MTWYRKISQDIGLIPDCITHFEQELEKAKQEVKILTPEQQKDQKYFHDEENNHINIQFKKKVF